MPSASVTIEAESYGNADAVFAALAGQWMGNICLRKAMAAAAKVVVDRAKALCPPPNYKGDKPNLKPLRDTIGWVFREYTAARIAVIGPLAPAGAHGHLVEHGHRMVTRGRVAREWENKLAATPVDQVTDRQKRALAGWHSRVANKRGRRSVIPTGLVVGFVPPKPFMGPASEQTKQQQMERFETVLRREVQQLAARQEAA